MGGKDEKERKKMASKLFLLLQANRNKESAEKSELKKYLDLFSKKQRNKLSDIYGFEIPPPPEPAAAKPKEKKEKKKKKKDSDDEKASDDEEEKEEEEEEDEPKPKKKRKEMKF